MQDSRGQHPNSVKNRFQKGHITKNCIICGKGFYFPPSYIGTNKGKTCSHKCSGIYRTGKSVPNRRTGKYIPCEVCNKMFYKTKSDIDRKYCSKKCFVLGRMMPKGKEHHMWKGGRITDDRGYILIYTPGHPHPNKGGKTPYVYEHRLVMEKILGRYLTREEKVHHKNNNRSDNSPKNLHLFVGGKNWHPKTCPKCGFHFSIK